MALHPDPVFAVVADTSVAVVADTSVVVVADTSVVVAADTSVAATVVLAFDNSLVEVEEDHNQDLALDQVVLAGTVLDTAADSSLLVLVALHLEVIMVPEGILNSSSEVELPIA